MYFKAVAVLLPIALVCASCASQQHSQRVNLVREGHLSLESLQPASSGQKEN
jgi:hypothetical protein